MEAEHLFDRNLLTATDTEIWEVGRVEALAIFSKDIDFYDRALVWTSAADRPPRSGKL
jgi:predicted nuclease of predicted toxin-antitoxin system